jgi:SAM-dependent methyltransferase
MNIDKTCGICGKAARRGTFTVKEMMFGLRDEFEYFECVGCGCLQIKEAPGDMSRYYPKDYRSFSVFKGLEGGRSDNPIKRYLMRKRTIFFMRQKGALGRALSAVKPIGPISKYLSELKKCGAHFDSKILDVGSGNGELLLQLARCGFKDLEGVDPHIDRDIIYANGVRIFKKGLGEAKGMYDILMLHHSLEHMEDQLSAFKSISRLLNTGGCALIRTPVVPSYAWEHYGVNWVQIDAPRHLFIHSLKSIGDLASRAALKIKETTFDSTEFQFIGSEQYARGISLSDERSYYKDPEKSVFDHKEVDVFKRGDQACFYLVKS